MFLHVRRIWNVISRTPTTGARTRVRMLHPLTPFLYRYRTRGISLSPGRTGRCHHLVTTLLLAGGVSFRVWFPKPGVDDVFGRQQSLLSYEGNPFYLIIKFTPRSHYRWILPTDKNYSKILQLTMIPVPVRHHLLFFSHLFLCILLYKITSLLSWKWVNQR